ncbi:MAG: DUF58 domain-containing protein [Gemmatimonadota bacterium]|nr:DUF58 domain-containing protein [Gemmatimonadota bacterium]
MEPAASVAAHDRRGRDGWAVLPLRLWTGIREGWARVRAWRRIHFTSGGLVFTTGTMAVGFAAMNTGNNLLYLLLGSMLGFIAVSGWLSEQTIRGLRVERRGPRSVTVGHDLRLFYEVTNQKTRLPSMAIEISESGLPEKAFLAHVPPGGHATVRSVNSFVRRGIYPLGTVTLSTGFPFGLFKKERDVQIPGEIVVWPRTDRRVREPSPGAGRVPRVGINARGASGARGEYRSLRAYRIGDDSRDIHWKSSARLREPVLRQYERDGAETRWICLDARGEPGDAAEVAIEVAAALAAQAVLQHRPFALVTDTEVLEAGDGAGHLERGLDMLARIDFSPDAAAPVPPVDPNVCVLVSIDGRRGFGDLMVVGRGATLDYSEAAG